jgi:predicted alpha/beta-fold hydrolase
LAHLLSRTQNLQHLKSNNELIDLQDGDHLSVAVTHGSTQLCVYLFHGLSGSADSDYMVNAQAELSQDGHTVVRVNHRGCGQGLGLARQPYHSGRGDDVSAVIEWGRKRWPAKKHVAIGFSLSGNALLCLLTGIRGVCLPDAAITINAPIDLALTAQRLRRGLNNLYDTRFVLRLRKAVKDRASIPMWVSLERFDDLYTAPAGNFKDRFDYYDSCSTQNHLQKIGVPTLILTSGDDPIVPVSCYQNVKVSSFARLRIEASGGHMGYLDSQAFAQGRDWLAQAIRSWVRSAESCL